MPVAIRLSRAGTKSKPFYRMIIVDSRKKRDGEFLENIGTYDGLKSEFVTFKPERFDAWVALGAQPSDTAKKLYRQYKNKKKQEAANKTNVASKEVKSEVHKPQKEQKQKNKSMPAEETKTT